MTTIAVENPATGEVIGTVPVVGAGGARRDGEPSASRPAGLARARLRGPRRGHAAGPALDARQRRARDRHGRSRRPARPTRTRRRPTSATSCSRSGSGRSRRAEYLADERSHYWGNPAVAGKKLVMRYEPLGVVGVIGPWNFPLVNGFGDCIPALMAGNSVILKPSEVTPLSSLLMAEMFARMRHAGGCLPGRDRRRQHRRGADRRGRLRHVHRLDPYGPAVAKAAAETLIPCHLELGGKDPMIVCADADVEQGRERRRVLLDEQRRAGLHLGRARVRRGADLRRVRAARDREGRQRCARAPPSGPGSVDVGAIIFPPQMEIVERPRARRRGQGREGRWSAAIVRADRAATSTSRPCSWTSTTRWTLHARGDVRPDRCRS